MSDVPTGNITADWHEFGHHFQIELLREPVMKGATPRSYRLWDNGAPALGGQWQHTEASARAWADYRTKCDYVTRIAWLEDRVHQLEAALWAVG